MRFYINPPVSCSDGGGEADPALFFLGQLYFAAQGSSLVEVVYLDNFIQWSLNQTHLAPHSPCFCCRECNPGLQRLLSYFYIPQTYLEQ